MEEPSGMKVQEAVIFPFLSPHVLLWDISLSPACELGLGLPVQTGVEPLAFYIFLLCALAFFTLFL